MGLILRIIKGADAGKVVQLGASELLVGSGNRAGLKLRSNEASSEHALLSVKNGDVFIENFSARGTRIDNQPIQSKTQVRPGDVIEISDQVAIVLESTESGLRPSHLIFTAVGALAVLCLILFVFRDSESSKKPTPDDWDHAYAVCTSWMQEQEGRGKLPGRIREAFYDAVRYERSGDAPRAVKAWGALEITIAVQALDANRPKGDTFSGASKSYPSALDLVLKKDSRSTTYTDEEKAAVLAQYIRRSFNFLQRKLKPK